MARDARHDDPLLAACPSTCPRLPREVALGVRHRFVQANGLRFHVVEAGSGPLVLLLHGFPEFWFGWRAQFPALAAQFRVVAPDLRGYNLSSKPPPQDLSGYDFETLTSDVPALIHALGAERAHVIAHDWGGMLGWGAAMRYPEVVERLAILNAPHPAAFLREIGRNPRQMLRSWYIALFQVRGLAEWLLARGQAGGLAALLRASAADPSTFPPEILAAYRRAILRPGAVSATLAWYRALWRTPREQVRAQIRPIQASTLLIWGMKDTALVPELTEGLEPWVPSLRVERIPEASHWVQHERPALINGLLLEHLRG